MQRLALCMFSNGSMKRRWFISNLLILSL